MPRAMSRAIEPVGMTFMATSGLSPSRMTEPLPNCLSIWARAMSRALSRSSVAMVFTFGEVAWSGSVSTLERGSDTSGGCGRPVEERPACGLRTQSRPNVCSTASVTRRSCDSALLAWHVELLADRQPHAPHRQAGLDRLDGAAAAQHGEDVVAGHALGAHGTELLAEPRPELLQSHDPDASAPAAGATGPSGLLGWERDRHRLRHPRPRPRDRHRLGAPGLADPALAQLPGSLSRHRCPALPGPRPHHEQGEHDP